MRSNKNEIISICHYAIVPQRRYPLLNVKVLASCPSDARMRQALEAVIIRKENPLLNRKQEYTNEPRKRKIKSENQ